MAFVKFMRNKFFHPHTFENQKRTWIAEQKHESEKKKQEELHKQYLKEQAIYENKNLLKHGKLTQDDKLTFMYEPPLECRKKDDKLELREVRFEWQKNAPRAGEYAKNIEVTDRPFGIEVRNTKCIKCGVWGHMNTDKICPLYNQGLNTEENPPELGKEDPMSLLNSMEKGGLRMRKHAVNSVMDVHDNKYGMLNDEKLDPEVAFIANLTDKQKRKLMRKLTKNQSGVNKAPKSKNKQKKKKKKRTHDDEDLRSPSPERILSTETRGRKQSRDGGRDARPDHRSSSHQNRVEASSQKRSSAKRRHDTPESEPDTRRRNSNSKNSPDRKIDRGKASGKRPQSPRKSGRHDSSSDSDSSPADAKSKKRKLEPDQPRRETERNRRDSDKSRRDSDKSRRDSDRPKFDSEKSKRDADKSKRDSVKQRHDSDRPRRDSDQPRRYSERKRSEKGDRRTK